MANEKGMKKLKKMCGK